MKFGFTKDGKHYTHSTAVLDAQGKPVWAVVPIPDHWRAFGRPGRLDGEDGLISRPVVWNAFTPVVVDPETQIPSRESKRVATNLFYPLRVLHNLRI